MSKINWGNLLFEQAKRAGGDEAARLFAAAGEKLAASAKIDSTDTYNLACIAALQGNEINCRHNLENAENHGALPDIEHLIADTDLDAMRNRTWFQELLRRQESK